MTVQEQTAPTGAGVLTNADGLIILTRPETAKKDTITIKIPDLFISIVGKPRELNPFLEETTSTDDWACKIKWLGYKDRILTVDEYLAFRRPSSGMGPTWSVTEANKIPCEVVEHPSVEIFRDLVIDIVSIANDIYSCPKDIPNGEGSNIISVLLRQGYSLQDAIDEAGKMVLDRYKIWEQAVRDLPSWGEEVDAVVLKLVQAYSNVCWGNMNWSFVTSRYMGNEKEQARTTGLLTFAAKDIEKTARLPQSS
ncbi:hypothetical protein TWF970_005637 [Orbilia oligospora]|uniref:Terpene synthase n=1 Tax=Orbilia oligospora TaxID=2813651 RepID=A0A7C8RKT9_ORBOL|nr:hypothetical protein TWF970_005637 [Orbilia oligospora]